MAGSAWLATRYFASRVRSVAEEATILDAEELRGVLEEQMLTGDRAALKRLVSDVGRGPDVKWVAVLNEQGQIRVSTDAASVGSRFSPSAPEVSSLRGLAPSGATRTAILVRDGCTSFRTVTPLLNAKACWSCHAPSTPVLGALIIDRSLDRLEQATTSGTIRLALGGVATLLVLLGSLGLAVERLVLRRLSRLGRVARRLAEEDFTARACDDSGDEIGELSHEFDTMASRLQSAVAACAAQRRQLGELVDGIADGVLLLTADLHLIKANDAFRRRLCGSRPIPSGTPYRELLVQCQLEHGEAAWPAERALATGRLEKQAARVLGSEGDRFEEIYAQPLRSADGVVIAVIEVWRDITDRKALEAGLEQSERLAAIGTLASSVAHEVGNPLASIITVVDGVLDRLDRGERTSVEEERENLDLVRRQVYRCRAVTQRLLGLARAPSVEVSVVDAGAAVTEVLALIAAQAKVQRVEVRADLAPHLLTTAAASHLEQIFLNIVLNALKVMPDGGALTVKGWVERGTVQVRFTDSGPGISSMVWQRLFQPFARGAERSPGTGLGLYVCQTLVSGCGGAIEAFSEPGRGATLLVRLPAVSLAEQRPSMAAADGG